MSTDNKMDVDEHVASTTTAKHASPFIISPPNAKRLKNGLAPDQLATVNDSMNLLSETNLWPQILEAATDKLGPLSSQVLTHLTAQLSTTDSKSSSLNQIEAVGLVKNFSGDELKEWETGLRKGVKERDWTDLITHPKLRKPNTTYPLMSVTSETPEEQAMRLHQTFQQEYRGGAVESFIKALHVYGKMYNPKTHFGRIIPLVQSSATGKSRLVEEMGKRVPTLSICLRESTLPSSGWPPNDEPAHRFLLKSRPESAQYKGEELAAAFLGAVAYVVGNKIKHQDPSTTDWMGDWRLESPTDIANSPRHRCFTEVEAKAEELLLENQYKISTLRVPSVIKGIRQPSDTAPDWHIKLFGLLTQPYFDILSSVMKEHGIKYFVFAFDECSQLNFNQAPHESGQLPARYPLWGMSLVALQRIIKAYDGFISDVPFWFLILDTNSSLIDMVPSGKDAPSIRFTKSHISLPPWSYFGFNQMVETNLSALTAHIKLPTDVLTMQHLKRYGRPYWSTLADREVLNVAYEKLFSRDGFRATNKDHVFAAFAVRACLEIGQGEASERLNIQAVRSHMRVLKSVVGSLAITTSPSEPMLALAATEGLNESETTYQQAMQTLLDELILKGLVLDRGLLGEVSSRILLLRARDKASTSEGNGWCKLDQAGVSSVPAVQLSKFLQTMLGQDLGIRDDQPEKSVLRNKLLEDTSEVWINFTHFVQLSVSIDDVTPSMLFEAWSSGFAFQCVFHQPVIDGFIVAYFGPLDESFDISKLFIVPWQTKARSDAAELALAQSLTAPFLVAGGRRRKPWHLVILFDLASSSAFGKRYGPHCDVTWGTPKRPAGKKNGGHWRGYAEPSEEEAGRYCLNIRGHRAELYPILQGLEKQFDQLFERSLGYVEPEFVHFAEEMEVAMERVTLD